MFNTSITIRLTNVITWSAIDTSREISQESIRWTREAREINCKEGKKKKKRRRKKKNTRIVTNWIFFNQDARVSNISRCIRIDVWRSFKGINLLSIIMGDRRTKWKYIYIYVCVRVCVRIDMEDGKSDEYEDYSF